MLTLLAVLTASTLAAGPGPGPETGVVEVARGDAAGLLEGVGSIPTVGTAGLVSVWGPDAFAVVLGGSGGQKAPIVAAACWGRGG